MLVDVLEVVYNHMPILCIEQSLKVPRQLSIAYSQPGASHPIGAAQSFDFIVESEAKTYKAFMQ